MSYAPVFIFAVMMSLEIRFAWPLLCWREPILPPAGTQPRCETELRAKASMAVAEEVIRPRTHAEKHLSQEAQVMHVVGINSDLSGAARHNQVF